MAQKTFNALLFDTRSIQRYIYSGNKLRTNIGASYIVDRIFFDVLIEGVLKKMFPEEKFSSDDDAWTPANDTAKPWEQMKSCCVAYVGGGNALLLFDEAAKDLPVEVVKNFTRKLLLERPGLKVGAAVGDLNLVDGKLNQKDIDALYKKLKDNQNNIFPAVNVPYTGLTLSCEINGEAANFYGAIGAGEKKFYSQETAVKALAADAANSNMRGRFNQIFALKRLDVPRDFEFPFEVENLGQQEGNNYFAVVHVDGNNMGVKFRTCKSLSERRKLSREIRRKTEGAFAELLAKILRMKTAGGFEQLLLRARHETRPRLCGMRLFVLVQAEYLAPHKVQTAKRHQHGRQGDHEQIDEDDFPHGGSISFFAGRESAECEKRAGADGDKAEADGREAGPGCPSLAAISSPLARLRRGSQRCCSNHPDAAPLPCNPCGRSSSWRTTIRP